MRTLAIVKLGSTLPDLADRGDFEDWIRAGLRLSEGVVRVIDAVGGAELPPVRDLGGAVLTGSAAMVTDRLPFSERAAAWLRQVVAADVPVLGICYGHQLLAHALGGEVGYNPRGLEMGTTSVRLHVAAQRDPLFAGLPEQLPVQASHLQSVLRLPPGATCLAENAHDAHHAFVAGRAWGVQFHPEFDAAAVRGYLSYYAAALRADGADPQALIAAVRETPESAALLGRFGRIAGGPAAGR